MQRDTLAILVGGGPAPGINSVIASAATEAINTGLRVIGIYNEYRELASGQEPKIIELELEDVSRIHATGGSMLRTSRTNPAKTDATLDNCVRALEKLGVRYLITIGGDDTTFGATKIAERAGGKISVASVPKTIDNDLPLPGDAPTFGYETARAVGATIVATLLEDARTTGRWYIVVAMGRKSGSLALGMCKSAGATLAVIPEEFDGGNTLELRTVVDTIAGSMIKRAAAGMPFGVAVVAEGIVERLSPEAFDGLDNIARDSFGHVRLADVPLGSVLRDAVRKRMTDIGLETTVVTKDIGYELRCAAPVAFDLDYTCTLGYGAVRFLLEGGSGSLVALSAGRIVPLKLEELLDPATGRIRTRTVDVQTEMYRVACSFMARLERPDFEEPTLSRLAAQTNLSPEEFHREFSARLGTAKVGTVRA